MKLSENISADIVRLWTIGGINNVARWLEILAGALFTLEATGSGFAVAAVTAARSLPLLLFGAVAGVVSEAVDRRHVQLFAMAVTAGCSATIAALACAGVAQAWHLALAGFISGTMWSTDLSTRRRMVGEAAPNNVPQVIAIDSMAGSLTRMIGPMAGGVSFALLGLGGAFVGSALLCLIALALMVPIRHVQTPRPMSLARVPRDLADGVRAARQIPVVVAVLGVTASMNLFAFSYMALVAPIGRLIFEMPPALVGALGAAEPLGALIGGMAIASMGARANPRLTMLGGSATFLISIFLMPLMPSFWLACLLVAAGGIGVAGFSNMQTALVLSGAPPPLRSRLLGLITVCIGAGPLGLLIIGALAEAIGPMGAVMVMAGCGMTMLTATGIYWFRSDPSPHQFAAPTPPPPVKSASTPENTAPQPADRRSSVET